MVNAIQRGTALIGKKDKESGRFGEGKVLDAHPE